MITKAVWAKLLQPGLKHTWLVENAVTAAMLGEPYTVIHDTPEEAERFYRAVVKRLKQELAARK